MSKKNAKCVLAMIIDGKVHYYCTIPGNFDSDSHNACDGWVEDIENANLYSYGMAKEILNVVPQFQGHQIVIANTKTLEIAA